MSSPTLAEGSHLGPYQILQLIGKGGMGEVYLALEERLRRKVALKIVSPMMSSNPDVLRRFHAEGRALALISHRNVVAVYAIDEIDKCNYIAMEYIEGKSLSAICRNLVFPASEAAMLFVQMLEGVSALHAKGVVHRDLKPANLIYQKDNLIKIVDLGIAKLYNENTMAATSTGVLVGTIQYIAPEIAAGKPATFLSDVWSLGAIFYELLTGSPLIKPGNHLQALSQLHMLKVQFPPECTPWIPAEMQNIVKKMLAPQMENRYKSAHEVSADLMSFISRHNPQGKWMFQYCGRDIKNVAVIKQRMAQQNFSEFAIKKVLFDALGEADMSKTPSPDVADKTEVISTTAEERVLTDASLNSAIRNMRTGTGTYKRASSGRTAAILAAVALGIAGLAGWMQFMPAKNAVVETPVVQLPAEKKNPEPLPSAAQAVPVPAPAPVQAPPANPVEALETKPAVPLAKVEEPVKVKPTPPAPAPAPAPLKPAKPKFQTLTPELIAGPASLVLAPKSTRPVFKWNPLPEAASYTLQISSNAAFTKIAAEKTLNENEYAWNSAMPGRYFWRVRAANAANKFSNYSEPGSIELKAAKVEMKTAAEQQVSPKNDSIKIEWTPSSLAAAYRLMLASDPNFKNVLESRVVNEDSALSRVPAGTYYAKVAVLDSQEREVSSYSGVATVVVKNAVTVQAPKLMSPPNNAKLMLSGSAAMVIFMWSKSETAEEYELELSSDANFTQPLVRKKLKTNRMTLKQSLPKGPLFWRIKALEKGGASDWSPAGRFELQ